MNESQRKVKYPCLIFALESNIGTGRNLEIYYKNLLESKFVFPIMVYTTKYAYSHAPAWISNKICNYIRRTDHDPEDCDRKYCNLAPEDHQTYDKWVDDCIPFVVFLRHFFGEKTLWLIDMTIPDLEQYFGKYIVQVFHGELFDDGKSYFYSKESTESFNRYWLLFPHGSWLKNKITIRAGIDPSDRRFKMIGRVLNDPLYTGELKRDLILRSYGLDPKRKTILYAPSYKSTKIWPIGNFEEDKINLEEFCAFGLRVNANIIFRPHPISIHHYRVKPNYEKVLKKYSNAYFEDTTHSALNGPDENLVAADIMVTDISSIVADFMSMDKPAIFLYPDFSQGVWGTNVPSLEQVSEVSYVVKDFPKLYALINRLLAGKESAQMVGKRKRFVSKALVYIDGSSGRRFRQILEEKVKHVGVWDFFGWSYLRRLIRHYRFILRRGGFCPVEMKLLDF